MEYAQVKRGHAWGCVWHCQPPYAPALSGPLCACSTSILSISQYFSVFLSYPYPRSSVSSIQYPVSSIRYPVSTQLYLSYISVIS